MNPDSTQPNDRASIDAALKKLALINKLSREELHNELCACSVPVFTTLRRLILDAPANLLKEVGSDQFRDINSLRTEWLVEGWAPYLEENVNPPRPHPAKKPHRIYRSVSLYPRHLAKVKAVRRVLEDGDVHQVSDSEVFRMAMDYLTMDKKTLHELHKEDQNSDARRRN